MNGIPVLASKRGAYATDGVVPENWLVENIEDLTEWRRKLEGLLAGYDTACALARDFSAERFSVQRGVDLFVRAVSALLHC